MFFIDFILIYKNTQKSLFNFLLKFLFDGSLPGQGLTQVTLL